MNNGARSPTLRLRESGIVVAKCAPARLPVNSPLATASSRTAGPASATDGQQVHRIPGGDGAQDGPIRKLFEQTSLVVGVAGQGE